MVLQVAVPGAQTRESARKLNREARIIEPTSYISYS